MSDIREALEAATDALESIALAGMSLPMEACGDEEAKDRFHARQAWNFIGIAARAKEAARAALRASEVEAAQAALSGAVPEQHSFHLTEPVGQTVPGDADATEGRPTNEKESPSHPAPKGEAESTAGVQVFDPARPWEAHQHSPGHWSVARKSLHGQGFIEYLRDTGNLSANEAKRRAAAANGVNASDALYKATSALMVALGYHGTINARDDRAQAVMDALAAIDAAGVNASDGGQR